MTQHAVNHRFKKAGVAKRCGFHAACRDVKTFIQLLSWLKNQELICPVREQMDPINGSFSFGVYFLTRI